MDTTFRKDRFSDYLEIAAAVVVACGGPKKYPCTSIQCFGFDIFRPFGTVGLNILFASRAVLNSGLGAKRDIARTIISHEQTQSNFPKDLLSDCLHLAVRMEWRCVKMNSQIETTEEALRPVPTGS